MTNISILPTTMQSPALAVGHGQRSAQAGSKQSASEFSKLFAAGARETAINSDQLVADKLGGMLLGSVMQLMIPKETNTLAGNGLSNDYWRSFLADAVAEAVSVSGKLDLHIVRK